MLFDAALQDRREITRATEASLGSVHPQTLATLAEECGLLAESGRPDEAIAIYPSLIERERNVLGFSHWRTIETTARYGAALKRAGNLPDAIDELNLGLEGTRSVRGPLFGDTFAITDFVVSCLEESQRFDKAQNLLLRSYADAADAKDIAAEKSRAGRLAAFYERRGDTSSAAQWKEIARTGRNDELPEKEPK